MSMPLIRLSPPSPRQSTQPTGGEKGNKLALREIGRVQIRTGEVCCPSPRVFLRGEGGKAG
jgi:hypothetical protein